MKVRIILFAVCGWLSMLSAQWLETTIDVPDSFCGVANPQCLAYDSTNNTTYVGGRYGNCVIAISGATNQKVARIPAGADIQALCSNSQNNKVYCANENSNTVTVIDGTSNQVNTTVTTGSGPWDLCCNLQN